MTTDHTLNALMAADAGMLAVAVVATIVCWLVSNVASR